MKGEMIRRTRLVRPIAPTKILPNSFACALISRWPGQAIGCGMTYSLARLGKD